MRRDTAALPLDLLEGVSHHPVNERIARLMTELIDRGIHARCRVPRTAHFARHPPCRGIVGVSFQMVSYSTLRHGNLVITRVKHASSSISKFEVQRSKFSFTAARPL
jgi:hypothetical protein